MLPLQKQRGIANGKQQRKPTTVWSATFINNIQAMNRKRKLKKTTLWNPTILPLYHNKFAQPYLSEERLGFLCASASVIKLNRNRSWSKFLNVDGTTLILIFWFPQLSTGPQKPQTLTASKTKYEKFGPKIQIPHWKICILVPYYFTKINFLTTKNTYLKLHDPNHFQFYSFYLIQKLPSMIQKRPLTFSKLKQ